MPSTRETAELLVLRRKPRITGWLALGWRVGAMVGLLALLILIHWLERDGLKDNLDGVVSLLDVVYFTMISATTTGYGDIVPVTERARLFDALIVTPIRIFFILILAGTAYTFVIKQTWSRWLMRMIQRNLRDHILIAGFGVSNDKAMAELLAGGVAPKRIVVIDKDQQAVDRASECGVAVMLGDASRDETLVAAHVERASALLVSAGRDDSAILIVLTARTLAPKVNISVTIRETDNEDIARQAGADTVINPVSFSGLLLASSLEGPHRAEYLNDLATSEGRVMLRERIVGDGEVGRSPHEICTGQVVRLIREGRAHAAGDPVFQSLRAGDRILEIIDSA
jgi:voltage-gated potassium channel